MSDFDQVIQSELAKGQARHGTAFSRQAVEGRGENVRECIEKELAGVWLYANLERGATAWLVRVLARIGFELVEWSGR